MNNTLKFVDANEFIGNIAFSSEAGGNYEVFGFCGPTVCCLDVPFPFLGIELSIDHNTVEGSLFFDAEDLIAVIKVSAKVLVVGVVARPYPIFISFRDGKLILRDL